jgi:hypothetical protein
MKVYSWDKDRNDTRSGAERFRRTGRRKRSGEMEGRGGGVEGHDYILQGFIVLHSRCKSVLLQPQLDTSMLFRSRVSPRST